MNVEKRAVLTIAFLFVLFSTAFAQNDWINRAVINVPATGTIETYLTPELHRLIPASNQGNGRDLDLTLIGPDKNSRAFELFWRESGDEASMMLKPDRVELQDDHQLLWEASIPQNYLFKSILVSLPDFPDAARLTFEGLIGDKWEQIDKNVAVLRAAQGLTHGTASVNFAERTFSKIRIYFAGFDKNFKETPIQAMSVLIKGRRGGMDFQVIPRVLDFEEVNSEDNLEVHIRMPGSGIMIENINIGTEALFQGSWSLGREKIVLGKREFSEIMRGEIDSVGDDPKNIKISPNMIWKDRTMVLILKSKTYFGKIAGVKCNMRLPRLVFVADIVGDYYFETGKNSKQQVLEYAGNLKRTADLKLEVAAASVNSEWQSESFVKDFSIRGGPFNSEGYSWKAPIEIEKPGFYQLQVSAKVALENFLPGLRVVKDGSQIPYFIGRPEQREGGLKIEKEYDAAKNQSIFTVHLPGGNILPGYLRVKTSGIFERRVFIEKHVAGLVGWQTWQTMTWKNAENKEINVHVNLAGFPNDQKDLRLVIENGSNQSLQIDSISAWYTARDLFFVASEKGSYELFGGNSSAKSAQYDLAIVQDKLLELYPEKITHGDLLEIAAAATTSGAGQDKGGPFEGAGYTWVASFTVPVAGLCQVALNQAASLDEYRGAIRIVKNGNQIPYFAGDTFHKKVSITPKENYDRGKNKTTIEFSLPVASKYWSSINFEVPGVFSRKAIVQIRKPGKLGWKIWRELSWVGQNQQGNSFALSLDGLPKGETDLLMDVYHGDNSPIVISSVSANYRSQDLFFDAAEPGEYFIYGGNSQAKKPSYDIAMIRDQLLKAEPQKILMGEASQHSEIAIKKQLEDVFSEKGWGLYLVLGLVTLVLIVVIVKVFPEEQAATEEKKDQPENKE